MAAIETEVDGPMQAPTEVAAVLGEHQAFRGLQSVQSALERQRRVQHKISAHAEGFTNGAATVENDDNDHFVLGDFAQAQDEFPGALGSSVYENSFESAFSRVSQGGAETTADLRCDL
jgi:hypothetical protein